MKKEIEEKYNIEIVSLIKNNDRVYRISTSREEYILKEQNSLNLESIFARLRILNIDEFVLPIRDNNDHFITEIEDKYYALFPYYEDEEELAKDIRLNFYIKTIASLHDSSSYPLKVNDGFFEESISFLDVKVSLAKQEILTRIERVEKENYHSPSDWYFLMNYPILFNALKEADKYITLLEEEWKEGNNIHLSLTYQNFSYDHILIKNRKIVSLDKMALAPSIYDLVFLFHKSIDLKIDLSYLIDQYLEIHKLESYEQNWLLAFLFIPQLERKESEIEDITCLYRTLSLLKVANEISTKF